MKNRKNIIITAILAMALAVSAHAQIFLEDESQSSRSSYGSSEEIGIIPYHQLENDQSGYVPTGCGIAMLVAFGGAYMLNRKKETNRNK